jgi:predicted HicB family RNase H-like nuclease
MRPYRGYTAEVWFEEDDASFHGLVAGIRDTVHFQGRTPEELIQAFHDSVDDYLEFCAECGKEPEKPYSGKLALRTTPEIHQLVSRAAASEGKSVNQWISDTLAEVARRRVESGATRVRS